MTAASGAGHGEATGSTPADSVFEEVIASHILHIAPRFLGDLLAGAKRHLDVSLLKYSHKLGGIPLCYSKIDLVPAKPPQDDSLSIPSAVIAFDNPCVHVPVRVYWMVFSPRAGSRLVGVVNQASEQHLGLLVLNYFSAVISASHLSAVLRWDGDEQCWTSRTSGEILLAGQEISFEVVEVEHDGPVLTIRGSLDRMLTEPLKDRRRGGSSATSISGGVRPAEPTSPGSKRPKNKRAVVG